MFAKISVVKAKVSDSCQILRMSRYFNVSRSTIYRHIAEPVSKNSNREIYDLELIESIFLEKRRRVGIRQLKMLIYIRFRKTINCKKIARIKNKYGLVTQIRKKRTYAKFLKLKQEHKTTPNHLNRKFSRTMADEVYSTDITQLNYGSGHKAYLAVFKDLGTKEVIASNLSASMDIDLVNRALDQAITKLPLIKRKRLMIHSDQGFHFTHYNYRNKLAANGIKQSMSRKGNCIDNAPIESFFGHLKDHLDLKQCKTLGDLKTSVTKEIDYYNNERPQWDLKKMPPKQYRRHLTLAQSLF